MPTVTFRYPDGRVESVDAIEGRSVMQTAVAADVDGIVAECGGNLMCATCHVYVDPEYLDKVDEVGEVEDEMLDLAASGRRDNSRLSCQLRMSDAVDGLCVTVPETQI